MIYDGENTFAWGTDLSATTTTEKYSDVIKTNKGDAYNSTWLMAHADQALAADMTITLETSADEAFTSPVALGTYALPKTKGSMVKAHVPVGDLGYLRIGYSTTTGTITAGKLYAALVLDVDI